MKRPLFASAALLWFVAPLWSQFSIAGPDTGKAGQTLAYALENSGQPVAADAWSQGFNPDRYAGYDYATSFLLTLKPQPDGTVQFTAPAPGRYRLIAFKNDVTVRKIVMISPVVISPAIRGLVLFLSANGNSSDAIRQAASDSLANARLAGATWIAITNYTCMQADAPGFPFSADPANCYSVQTTDLEWILDEAHRQGLKVALEPGAKGRLGTGVLTDLQFYLQGLSDANILQIQQSYGAFILSMATVAQKHGVEALFVGDNWQMLSPWSQSLLTSMNLQWDALVGQIRSAFAGKIWMGWVFSCLGQWPGFADWSRVDAIHHLDRLTPSGTACQNPVVPGIFNLSAEEMAVRLQKQFELPVFQLQARTHLPLIWGDFYPVAYDGTGFFMEDNTPWNGVPVIDRQEMIDGFEARMRAITFSGGDGFFVWGTPDAAFMSAASNWWGGNPKLFEPCLQPMVDGVLFQRSSTCPLPSATGVSDSWDDFTMVEDVQFNGGGGIAQVAFRIPISGPYAAYNVQLGATSLSLTKFVNGASLKLGGYNIPGGSLGKLLRITVTAVGPSLSVAVNGIVVIRAVDNNAPLLSGTTQWGICCGSASVQYGDVVVSTLANASSTAPQVKAVTNAASFLTGTISPGEIITLFGSNLGPLVGVGLTLNPQGQIGSTLGGAQVLFDGIAAPLLYVGQSQITAVVPFAIAGSSTSIRVVYNGNQSEAVIAPISATAPGVFSLPYGKIIVLNQDGTFNSPNNPAPRGSAMVMFLTGDGRLLPEGKDGEIVGGSPPKPTSAVRVLVNHVDAVIDYAGVAPFETNGLMQINFRAPTAPAGTDIPVLVTIGNYASQSGQTIAFKE